MLKGKKFDAFALKGLMQIFNAISAKNLLIQDFYFLYG